MTQVLLGAASAPVPHINQEKRHHDTGDIVPQTISSAQELDATQVGTIVRDAQGRLGEVQNTGGRNFVAFVGVPHRLWWTGMQNLDIDGPSITPLTVVLRPEDEDTLCTEVSILYPSGARTTTIPTALDLGELTVESASDYVARRNAYEGNIAVVQTRLRTDWKDLPRD